MTLSRHEIEEIARGTEGYAPDAVLGYPVSTIRALCALALQALDAGQPVAVKPLEQLIVREARRQEILDWLQDQIGTGWTCGNCGHFTYHAFANECADCGAEFPPLHMLAFKLHASGTDNEEYLTRVRGEFEEAGLLATPSADKGEPVAVERIECVNWSKGYEEPAEPIWRIVLDGYCADFDSEAAATNFARAIERRTALSAGGAANTADNLRAPALASPSVPADKGGPQPFAWHWWSSNNSQTWPVWSTDPPPAHVEDAIPLYRAAPASSVEALRDADTIAQLVKERDEARATNCRLHRRVQQDEGRVFRKAFRLAEAGWDSIIVKWVHEKVAAESRASKAEAEAATLREALERAEIELEAAKAFGGGWFGNVKESVRNHYRVDARRARTQQHGAKE
jgi:hypothetical protein